MYEDLTYSPGYGIRGAVYPRTNEEIFNENSIRGRDVRVHLLHAESKSLKQVCRSTYAAELLASAGALDSLVPLSVTMYEIQSGPIGATKLKNIREKKAG